MHLLMNIYRGLFCAPANVMISNLYISFEFSCTYSSTQAAGVGGLEDITGRHNYCGRKRKSGRLSIKSVFGRFIHQTSSIDYEI